MTQNHDQETCDFCKTGKVVKRAEQMGFIQWTKRGYVHCKVVIPVGICDHCGARSWDKAAEAIIEEAVRAASDEGPPS